MAKRDEPYVYVVVESYYPASTAGLHGPIHVRPVEGQPFPTHLHVECSKALVDPTKHPVGTSRAFPKFEIIWDARNGRIQWMESPRCN